MVYAYDLAGNRLSISLNGTLFLGYTYDDAGRLSTMTRGSGTYNFFHDAAGRRAAMRQPNNVWTGYTYDAVSRLLETRLTKGTIELDRSTYTLDALGNRLSKTTPEFSESYTYDPLSRLTQVARGATTTESYSYDAVGNRLSSLTIPTWSHGDRNELLSVGAAQFTYDLNGNLATSSAPGDSRTYEWDAENRLKRVVRNGAELARFAYDPLGRRIEKTAAGVTQRFVYDGEDIVLGTTGMLPWLFHHGPGIDEVLAKEYVGGATYFTHADGLGSLVKSTDASGAVVFTRRYDAFGNLELGAQAGEFAFTGREWDPETGLYYYRARYYDPKIGRLISEDPIGFSADVNFYAYVFNNPVNWVDPLGLDVDRPGLICRNVCESKVKRDEALCAVRNPDPPSPDAPKCGETYEECVRRCQENVDYAPRPTYNPRPGIIYWGKWTWRQICNSWKDRPPQPSPSPSPSPRP
jgi:RHS repeat-associated protein